MRPMVINLSHPHVIYREGNGNPLQYSCLENPMDRSQTRLSDFTFTFHFRTLEKNMATHSSVLAWRIPGTGEPGGLPSLGSHRVRHDWSDLAAAAAAAFGLNLKQVSISIICKLTLISLHDIVISADLCFIMNSLAGQTFLGVSQSISWLMVKFESY